MQLLFLCTLIIGRKKMDELYAAALEYYSSGNYDHAIESYEQILQIEDVDLVHTKIDELKDEKRKLQ